MHLREILLSQLTKAHERFAAADMLTLLETGTIRNADPKYELDDGWSTLIIAEWMKGEPQKHAVHGFYSLDLNTWVAREVLKERGLLGGVFLRDGHSVSLLGRLIRDGALIDDAVRIYWTARPESRIHLAYLDSDNDPALILDEYLLVTLMMPPGGIVLIDDCDPETGGMKGMKIIPWLTAKGIPFELRRRDGKGYATNVLITEVPGEAR